jgi:hypothetical protein
MELAGVRTAIKTVFVATPILGGTIAFIVGTSELRNVGLISRVIGGAMTGATVGTAWEYTLNRDDAPEIKAEVILGSAGIGAAAAVVGPVVFGG